MQPTAIPRLTAFFAALFTLLTLSPAQAQKRPDRAAKRGNSAASAIRQDYPAPPLPAAWVWLGTTGADQAQATVGCFRKLITLKTAPRQVAAWISADRHYRLTINGRMVSKGPTDPGADYPGGKNRGNTGLTYCDYRDLTPAFHAGVNVITVEVFAAQLSSWYGSSGHPGLFFQARITAADASVSTLQADASWRGRGADYFRPGRDGIDYLAAQEPAGWQSAGFDDASWLACARITSSWPNLQTSQIPPMREVVYPLARLVRVSPGIETLAAPFRKGHAVTLKTDGSLSLQYDRVLSAYVRLKIKGGAGATLRLALNETNAPGGLRTATLHLDGGEQTFETPFYSSFTVINLTAAHVTQPIEIQDVTALFVSYPVTDKGAFSCSDSHLDRLWEASRWATRLCMQDHYLDSPDHQEPICDPGDYMIEALLNAYAFAEPALTRQELRKFGALLAANHYINFHTSYALLWLQMLLDYYDTTGDVSLVRELSPQAFGLLDRFATWRGKNGLISEAPDYMFMDWVEIAGIGCHHPPAVIGQGYLTAFYYRALADAARVADLVGEKSKATAFRLLRPQVAAAFQRELWNPKKGFYRDGKPFQTSVKPGQWLPADTDIETFSPHVNVLAVLYDLAPKEQQTAILTRVMKGSPLNCQPYFYHFVFNALDHVGMFEEYATAEMKRWEINPQTGSFREMWTSGDWSHAWGGTPLYQLSSKVLGVTPETPGFDRIAIRPTLCDLWWARGRVPTPHGNVDVSWQRTENGLQLDVTVPPGAEANVLFPLHRFPNAKVILQTAGKARSLPVGTEALRISAGQTRFVIE
jgi:alpha-L-rhamnosidase